GAATGAAVVDVDGGTAPYMVDWSNGNTGFTAGALAAGMYEISVTDANGCEQIGSTEILQPAVPLTADYTTEDVSCYGGENGRISLTTSGGTKPYRYSLDGENFVGSELLIALEPGYYQVIVEDANGCTFVTSDILINEPDPLTVNLGADILMEFGDVITFMPEIQSTNPIVNYTWSANGPGELTCYDCPNPSTVDSFDVQTSFLLTIEDINGCTAQDRVNLVVRKERRVYVPTGFTPNNDGSNDRLIVHGEDGTYIKLFQVFDRWGEIVYQNGNFPINDEISGWDGFFRGQAMNSGVYIWYLEVEYFDGEEESYKGSTNLIR
ncbi:MAG: gliding motility-associated C-terminal domain-containing protein, partial [Phaeodactylibacter sp.]|nr:gliding motility-associated C-terminal domain-containing protein [Phaeodactylibacter sp.]